MRRHDTHSSDASAGKQTRSGAGAPALQRQAGNRALAELLGPRSVQRAPADFHPEEIDYANLRGPKALDRNFKLGSGDTGPPDTGFTVPHKGGHELDLGYGGTGDSGFATDYRHDGGRQSGGVGSVGAGLSTVASSVGLGGVAEAAAPALGAASDFIHEIPFLGDLF